MSASAGIIGQSSEEVVVEKVLETTLSLNLQSQEFSADRTAAPVGIG